MSLQVDLLFDTEEPRIRQIRLGVKEALLQAGYPPYWHEWQAGSPNLPSYLERVAQAQAFVNGRPAFELQKAVSDVKAVTEALIQHKMKPAKSSRGVRISSFFNLIIPFLAVLAPKCPVCWASYFSFLGNFGIALPFFPGLQYYLYGVAIALCLFLLYRAPRHRGYFPPLLMCAALSISVVNSELLDNNMVLGAAGFILSGTGAALLIVKPAHKPAFQVLR